MTTMTLSELSEEMRDIDFAMLTTHSDGGAIASRPMSNNGDVEYKGSSFFFTDEDTLMVKDITDAPKVALTFTGKKGLLGKPPIFIAVQGEAELIRDKAVFALHWTKDLERWFKDGVNTPGIVMIKVNAKTIHYWKGEEEAEIAV